ncbi:MULTISPECIES: GNAT family N-acetyltransferase [Priestia]|uniref:GNAT family N-acetyltransferase n=1 Tax=Priestia TaxID=2800373 RepID=UPI00064EE1C3|nr:GNAT family N-acetyltransferase [Priestia aryabhattai]NLR43590.1 GNAT family N-acetyltransferase [Priestia megaterium]KML26986.1 GCN5 family acetyltransferase [Priestia aryabhattai]KMN98987.1 GCN5 family acetyltransferase [Priestia aryabhattai]MED3952197.1 GNAT family N-acetyltransferase [Priestia aryabhattai]MED4393217.1 GNAT family N-acetyltransferase [Priestia aryabhattai]
MKFCKATVNEIDQLIYLRKKQLVDEGIEPNQEIDTELKEFFTNKMSDGSLIEWIVEDNEEIIATGAIVFYEFPPTYTNKSGKKAYITNMYTKESYRGQGIATKLLTKLVAEAKTAGIIKIWLGASNLGRPVYKKFGFKEADEWLELDI